jgi:hypothetical protein
VNLDLARTLLPDAKHFASLASEEWAESYDVDEKRAEICIKDNMTGEIMPIAHILPDCPYDDRMLMIKAPLLMRALLVLLKRAFNEVRALKQEMEEPRPDLSKACATLCDDPSFKKFLSEKHGAPTTDRERFVTSLRKVLEIESRTELNTHPAAARRFKALLARFEQWKDAR